MSKKLLYTTVTRQGESRKIAALFEDSLKNEPGREFHFSGHQTFLDLEYPERAKEYAVGNIYVARLAKHARDLHACFFTLAPKVNGFLPTDRKDSTWVTKRLRVGEVAEGEEVLVQIVRESDGTKLCRLTTELSLSSSGVVALWGKRSVSVSGKMSEEQKNYYRALGQKFQDHIDDDLPVGILFRTNAAMLSDQELFREFSALRKTLLEIVAKGRMRQSGTCLFSVSSDLPELFRKNLPEVTEVITDDADFFHKFENPDYQSVTHADFYLWRQPLQFLASAASLPKFLDQLNEPRVDLAHGGWIMIEQTEACVVIDVNSGPLRAGIDAEENYRAVNREAAAVIARELRLRNLGGLILIDFISMKSSGEEDELLRLLNSHLKDDPNPARAVDFTAMHICEVTRKRIRAVNANQ